MSRSYLSDELISQFERNGYLVLKNWWDETTVNTLRNKTYEVLQNEDLSKVKSVFTTKEQDRETDNYFLNSAREISFFWVRILTIYY